MRSFKLVALTGILALSLAACGSDGDGGGTADAPPVVADSAGGGESPVITGVAWTHAVGCAASTPSDVEVVITVTDADSAAGTLVVTGNVASCGAIDALTSTISCPQAAPYSGTVTVTDPESNADTMTFSISPCVDGSAP